MKKCPYCNEEIQDIAKKCRFCGEWLEQGTTENLGETTPINKEIIKPTIKATENPKSFVGFITRLFKGRLGRLDYLLSSLFYIVFVSVFSSIFLVTLSSFSENGEPSGLAVFIVVAVVFCALALAFSGHTRRLHDIEMSGFWALILLIPYIGILFILYLLLAKGDTEANFYGVKNTQGKFFERIFNLHQA